MPDLPDYYLLAQISEAEAASFKGGLDANKSATPVSRNIYLATDTVILYVCTVDGVWANVGGVYLPLGGGTMGGAIAMGANKITGLADPTLAQDAATRAYVLARVALRLALTGGAMTGAIAMGANKITGLADPAAAQDAATRAYVLARCGLYLPLAGGTLTGDLTIGAHLLKTTNLALVEGAATYFYVRNAANTAYRHIMADYVNAVSGFRGAAAITYLATHDLDNARMVLQARDGGDALVEIARLQGAATAYLQATRGIVLLPMTDPANIVEGWLFYDSADDKLKYKAAAALRLLLTEALAATTYLALAGGTMAGNIAMGGNKVTGLGAPAAAGDAARKTETDLLTLLTTFNDHHARHENGGADEPSVTGLSGLLADDQHGGTKQFFIPCQDGTENNPIGYLVNAEADNARITFVVPHDYSSITSAVLPVQPLATATHRLNFTSYYGTTGEAYNADLESDLDVDSALTANQWADIDVSGILSDIAAGDRVHISIVGDGTNIPNLRVAGIDFRYS